MATAPIDKAPWQAEGTAKREAVQGLFAEIAPRYDLLNGLMSLARHRRWRAFAVSVLQLKPGDAVLDLCCGTGDFMSPIRKAVGPKGRVVGVDFCLPMLQQARRKRVDGGLVLGDAGQTPLQSASVQAVTVGWGIRNVPDVDAAHREIFRVLGPGGSFVSVDMAIPENRILRWGSGIVCGKLLPALGAMFGFRRAYTYLPKSTERFRDRQGLADSMRAAGFVDIQWRNFMFGNIAVHWGRKP